MRMGTYERDDRRGRWHRGVRGMLDAVNSVQERHAAKRLWRSASPSQAGNRHRVGTPCCMWSGRVPEPVARTPYFSGASRDSRSYVAFAYEPAELMSLLWSGVRFDCSSSSLEVARSGNSSGAMKRPRFRNKSEIQLYVGVEGRAPFRASSGLNPGFSHQTRHSWVG